MLYKTIKKLLGLEEGSQKNINSSLKTVKNVNYASVDLSLNNNIVHSELKEKQEIEDLYAEIRVLQAKNREKINRNKISYNIK